MTHVAIVCLGNVARSPMAEHLFRARLPETTFTSAGLDPLELGGPMTLDAAWTLQRHGLTHDHVCRGITRRTLAADVILTVDHAHRAALVRLGAPPARLHHLPSLDPRSADHEDVGNPYRRTRNAYGCVFGLLERCVPALRDLIARQEAA